MSRKSIVGIAVSLVAVLVIAGGIYAFTLFSGPSPEEAMAEAIETIEKLESYSFTMDMEMSTLGQTVEMTMEGQAQEAEDVGDAKVSMEGSMDVLGQEMKLYERILGGKVYMKYEPDPTGAEPQWYYMDFDLTGLQSAGSSGSNPTEYLEYLGAFSSVESKGTQSINGVECRQYYLEIDGEKLADLALENYEAMAEQMPQAQSEEFSAEMVREMYAEMDMTMDLFLGVDDGLPYREVIRMTLTSPIETDVTITMDLFDFNEPVEIEAPANAVPMEMGGTALES